MSMFRILVVDDEEDVRTVERVALGVKYEVVEAHDGLDALEKLERVEPDLVVLDVMMPLMDGFEACRAIRNDPKFRAIPVLFLSAKRTTEAIKEGYGAGADFYLTKPFEPERLVRMVEQFFQESRVRPSPKKFTMDELKAQASQAPAAGKAESKSKRAPAEAPGPAKPPAAATPPTPVAARPPRPRVMVVDDEADVLTLIGAALSDDFEVTTAENGIQAVERIILYQPDLIVLDAMLPKMSGYQLCASLRRNHNYARTPIVFITAKASARDKDYCRRLGANEFLGKPFDPQDLRSLLLSYAKAPTFALRPKKMTMEQITVRESSSRWEKEKEPVKEDPEDPRRELKELIDREMRE